MGGEVTVTPDQAAAFLRIPEVWDRASDDLTPTEFEIPDDTILIGWRAPGGELGALALLHPYRDGWKIHYYVLEPWRMTVARPFFAYVLDPFAMCGADVYVAIAKCYRGVANFARRFGFETIEIEPAAFLKRGERFDREIMVCRS